MIFSDRLKELRKSKSATQLTLASVLEITDRGYRKYESGENEPTLSILVALADYFDVSLDYLCGRSDDPRRR